MSWEVITEAKIQEKLHANEWAKLSAKFAEAAITVTNLVRGYVASSGADLDADTTKIPDRLTGPACDYLVVELYKLNGGTLVDPKDTRRDAKREAIKLFERVADGKFSIEDPTSGAESESSGGISVVGQRTARVTKDNMRGL